MISVIIPLYNKAASIQGTIQSVLEQSYQNFEIVVINDGSTDDSANIVSSISSNRIRLINQRNAGVSAARNRGVREAKGEWILFLDADDCLYPQCLGILNNKTLINNNVDVICGNYYKVKANNKQLYTSYKKEGVIKNPMREYFFLHFSMRMGCFLLKKEALDNISFDETLSRFEDMKWILEILRKHKVYSTPNAVMEYRLDNVGLSRASSDKTKDFTFGMTFSGKSFWEKCCLGKLLFFASFTYPNEKTLRNKYGIYFYYMYIANILLKLSKIKRLLWQ